MIKYQKEQEEMTLTLATDDKGYDIWLLGIELIQLVALTKKMFSQRRRGNHDNHISHNWDWK